MTGATSGADAARKLMFERVVRAGAEAASALRRLGEQNVKEDVAGAIIPPRRAATMRKRGNR
jgi:hypothetical protein